MSTLKAMEEQKVNRVFENTEFYMKPIVEVDFQGKQFIKQETLKDIMQRRKIRHKLYMREFYETNP